MDKVRVQKVLVDNNNQSNKKMTRSPKNRNSKKKKKENKFMNIHGTFLNSLPQN